MSPFTSFRGSCCYCILKMLMYFVIMVFDEFVIMINENCVCVCVVLCFGKIEIITLFKDEE